MLVEIYAVDVIPRLHDIPFYRQFHGVQSKTRGVSGLFPTLSSDHHSEDVKIRQGRTTAGQHESSAGQGGWTGFTGSASPTSAS